MNISAQDVINAIFHPDDTVCLRIFDDRKEGIFIGCLLYTSPSPRDTR